MPWLACYNATTLRGESVHAETVYASLGLAHGVARVYVFPAETQIITLQVVPGASSRLSRPPRGLLSVPSRFSSNSFRPRSIRTVCLLGWGLCDTLRVEAAL